MQDLVIRPHVVNFRRERWQGPDGGMVMAPLPAGISGHFGPELRRFVLAQYHQGQVTVPRLLALLRAFGIVISKRQLVRLLIAGQDGFLAENRDVLRAGLSSAAWITVDDTGARHKAANGVCTQIGNAHFAWQQGERPSARAMVRHDQIEEPQQLPRSAARRPRRLRRQCGEGVDARLRGLWRWPTCANARWLNM